MSKPTPNVAVIMAAYNVDKYIKDAIYSVMNQEYPNYRLSIYNDGSKDDTVAVINTVYDLFEQNHADLNFAHFINNPENKGLSYGRNALIQKNWDWADYFMILDADDQFIGEDKITQMVNVALSSDLIGVVYCDYQNWNEKTGEIVREYKRGFSRHELREQCILSDSGTLVSKRAYAAVGPYDESLKVGMDYDMWLRISEKFLIYHLPKCLTQVTIRSGSLSSSPENAEIWRNNVGRVYEKLRERENG